MSRDPALGSAISIDDSLFPKLQVPRFARDDKSKKIRMTRAKNRDGSKKIRPLHGGGAACVGEILRGGRKTFVYRDGGAGFVVAAGACCPGVAPSTELVIRRISTRRFLARPSLVLLSSTGLSLPSPTK
jgi:hypothetical protein